MGIFGRREEPKEEPEKQKVPDEVAPPVRIIPESADYVVMYHCGGWWGYRWMAESIKQVTPRYLTGMGEDGMKFSMLGGTIIERQIIPSDTTIDDVLGGIYCEADFEKDDSSEKDDYASSTKYLVRGKLNDRYFTVECRKMMEIVSDREVKLVDKDNRVIRLIGDDLEVYCDQIEDDDDSSDDEREPLDLRDLGAPIDAGERR